MKAYIQLAIICLVSFPAAGWLGSRLALPRTSGFVFIGLVARLAGLINRKNCNLFDSDELSLDTFIPV